MYQFLNVHPEGKFVADCVKRAITTAAEMDYHEVQLELNRHKRITGAKTFNEDRNWKSYLMNVLNASWTPFPATKGMPRMNGERFCKSHPKGRYVLSMAGHLSCCVDGVIYDTWDCQSKTVYGAYQIDPEKLAWRYFRIIKENNKTYIQLRENYYAKDSFYEVKDAELPMYKKCLKTLGFKKKD